MSCFMSVLSRSTPMLLSPRDGSLAVLLKHVRPHRRRRTMRNRYPLPRIDDVHDSMAGAKVLSNVDRQGAYTRCATLRRRSPRPPSWGSTNRGCCHSG